MIKLLNGQDLQQSHEILGYNLCVSSVSCTHFGFVNLDPTKVYAYVPPADALVHIESLSQTR